MANGPNRRKWTGFFVIFVLLIGLIYIPVPYFVSQPGDAIDLAELVHVVGGYEQEGRLMLTTIKLGKANLLSYAWAKMSDYVELIEEEQVLASHRNEEEYHLYQQGLMEMSKDKAIIAAFRLAKKEVEVLNHGVTVMGIVDELSHTSPIKVGDLITAVDHRRVDTVEGLIGYLKGKKVGDEVVLTIKREDKTFDTTVTLRELADNDGKKRASIGILAVTERSVITVPPVEVDTRRIGGPSAGMMFALQIYNAITPEDLTKGYRIAGTGTVDEQGHVGRIGGVHQKVVAAHKAGAEIFFAPHEGGKEDSNYWEALKTAEDIGSRMQIVPVDHLQDVIRYMESLPPKQHEFNY